MTQSIFLALGDSTGVGVGAASGGGYPQRLLRMLGRSDLQLMNLCRSGATSADVLSEQLPRALKESPAVATIGIGINDVGLQVPDEAFALNLEEIVGPLKARCPRILIANLPDLALAPAVAAVVPRAIYENRLEMFNEHIAATAARHGLALVDLYSFSKNALPGRNEIFSPDGFHPSAVGYEEWATYMLPYLRRVLDDTAAASA
ncbi:MAG TPA: SGNH/GDSL hydrolase family protein [Myxococcales bacterium]|nr:SGNH/GDSL hydrolase family protein [Myxococcales bacterium]